MRIELNGFIPTGKQKFHQPAIFCFIHPDGLSNTSFSWGKMAVIHYQFEAIHPFDDGNGRTGRILNILYLVLEELLTLPVLYMSGYIINRKADYYKLLRKVTEEEDWESWNLFMLEAIEKTAQETTSKIEGINNLLEETIEEAKAKLPDQSLLQRTYRVTFLAILLQDQVSHR